MKVRDRRPACRPFGACSLTSTTKSRHLCSAFGWQTDRPRLKDFQILNFQGRKNIVESYAQRKFEREAGLEKELEAEDPSEGGETDGRRLEPGEEEGRLVQEGRRRVEAKAGQALADEGVEPGWRCSSKTDVAGAVVGSPGGSGRELDRARQAEGFSDQTHPGLHPCPLSEFQFL